MSDDSLPYNIVPGLDMMRNDTGKKIRQASNSNMEVHQ